MKQYSREELEELLRINEPDFKEVAPSTDVLAMRLEKISPFLKIRLCPIGYFSDDDGRAMPSKDEERWGSTVDGDGTDYCWCGSLWETLAIAYLRITKVI